MKRVHWTMAVMAACVMAGATLAQGAGPGPGSGPQGTGLFERFDTNGDGLLSRSEVPPRAQRLFDRLGKDQITRQEVEELRSQIRQGQQLGQGQPGRGRGEPPQGGRGRRNGQGPRPGVQQQNPQAGQRWGQPGRGGAAGPRAGAGQNGARRGAQGPWWQGQRDAQRVRAVRELRRDHPVLFRELMRMRRLDPRHFRSLWRQRHPGIPQAQPPRQSRPI